MTGDAARARRVRPLGGVAVATSAERGWLCGTGEEPAMLSVPPWLGLLVLDR